MGGTLPASLKAGWSQWEKCGIIVVYFGVRVRRPTSSRPCRVLSLPRADAFRLYILWLPVLEADTLQAAERVRECLPEDDRMGHFWDHDLGLSHAYYRVLQLGQHPRRPRIAWDLFLLYDAGSVWCEDPPVPALWMHQLFLEDVPRLDATVLRGHLERRLSTAHALPEAPETEES